VLQQQLRQQLDHQQPRPAAGPIQLAAAAAPVADIEARLLLDWSQVPLLLDPAFGGRLADADVVRAGKGRMNTRALRKRVQVGYARWLLADRHTLGLNAGCWCSSVYCGTPVTTAPWLRPPLRQTAGQAQAAASATVWSFAACRLRASPCCCGS
jgi:hypothetical protein